MLKRWISYYFFLLAALVFALLYPGRVSSAFFYAMLLLPLVSLLFSALMLGGFSYRQTVDRLTATKGETVTFRLALRNRNPLLVPFIEASFYGAGSFFQKEFRDRRLAAPARKTTSLMIPLDCKFKGTYEIGLRQLRLSDYCGLFTFRQAESQLGTLTVYPRIVPIQSFPAAPGNPGDSMASGGRSRDSTENVSDIRKYASGDRLRSVHWKLSAKKEELMVKNFEQSAGTSVSLVLDASGISQEPDTRIPHEDRLVESTVSLAYYFAANSIPATLLYSGNGLVKQRLDNLGDFQLAYRMMTEASFRRNPTPLDIAALVVDEGSRRRTVAIVAAALENTLAGQALRLKASGFDVVVISVPPNSTAGEAASACAVSLREAGIGLYTVPEGEDIGSALARGAGG